MQHDAGDFIDGLIRFSGNRIKNTEDISLLYSAALEHSKMDDFEKTSFTAKYINGLKRVLLSGAGNPEISNTNQIKKDLSDNIQKILVQIKDLLEGGGNYEMFEKKYLEISQESFSNLNVLLEDLEWVKMYLNDLKRN